MVNSRDRAKSSIYSLIVSLVLVCLLARQAEAIFLPRSLHIHLSQVSRNLGPEPRQNLKTSNEINRTRSPTESKSTSLAIATTIITTDNDHERKAEASRTQNDHHKMQVFTQTSSGEIELIDRNKAENHEIPMEEQPISREIRSLAEVQLANMSSLALAACCNPPCKQSDRPAVFGLRCDNGEMVDGELIIKANEPAQIILIGQNLELNFSLALTPMLGEPGEDCTDLDRVKSIPVLTYLTTTSAQVTFNVPWPGSIMPYYLCIRELKDCPNVKQLWYHQGSHQLVRLYVHEEWLSLYMKMFVIACLLMLSGLFSGLNLGLMSLDKNELAVIISCGSETEKRYARAIEPVRRRGNYLLCSILFSNVLVNSTIAVLLEDLTSGSVAVMTSTIFIVMFGEILPQAFCSRHGLAVGAKTVMITQLCMILTCPLSYPVSACLDWALGEEISHAYDRERLMEFIRITSDYNNLETEEVNIISGALKLKRVHLVEVMTRIEDTFMLDVSASLDFDTIKAIVERGYSRVPVHEANNKRHIIALLFTKDLALLDPDDRTPVQTLISFYDHPVMFMFEDTTLHEALNEFKTGKSHMAFVRRVLDDGDRDPIYEVTGIVTFEDVIEEILQMEINDETDTVTDNRRRRRRKETQVRDDFLQFTKHHSSTGDWPHDVNVTPQLCLAAYQFLSTNVAPFGRKFISDLVLKRLLAEKIYHKLRVDPLLPGSLVPTLDDSQRTLYKAGQPADYFIMILEGRVSVICGSEGLAYEGGPFSHFGKRALQLTGRQALMLQQQHERALKLTNQQQQATAGGPPPLGAPTSQTTQTTQITQTTQTTQTSQTQMVVTSNRKNAAQQNNQQQSGVVISMRRPGQSGIGGDIELAPLQQQQQQQQSQNQENQDETEERGVICYSEMSELNDMSSSSKFAFPGPEASESKFGSCRKSLAKALPGTGSESQSLDSIGLCNGSSISAKQDELINFVPDFTVQVISNASYLRITRDQYLSALKATLVDNQIQLAGNQQQHQQLAQQASGHILNSNGTRRDTDNNNQSGSTMFSNHHHHHQRDEQQQENHQHNLYHSHSQPELVRPAPERDQSQQQSEMSGQGP